jgi:hypothetical protein
LEGRTCLLRRTSLDIPGRYSIARPRLKGGGHKYVWNLFDEVFSNYKVSEKEKSIFSFASGETPEIDFRDIITYGIYPGGFADLYAPSLVGNARYEASKNFLESTILNESMNSLEMGIEESLAGESIHQILIMLGEIVSQIKHGAVFKQLIENWLDRFDVFDFNEETRKTLKSWIRNALQTDNKAS